MSIKASELPNFKDKIITVQVDLTRSDPGGDETYREVTGRCLHATPEAIAVQPPRGKMEIIKIEDILDVDEQARPRRLVRRWIDVIPTESVRQHLIDRHGMPFDLVRALSVEDAEKMHNTIKHDSLGHEHGDKPARIAGRPRYARPED